MATEKILNTRIQLKYDTLANWQSANTLLKQGEVAFVQIAEASVDNKGNRVAPPVMFKVGPGNFNDLGWGAAKAADVYAWAKKENLDLADLPDIPVEDNGTGKFVTDVTWDATNNKIVITRADVVGENAIVVDNAGTNAKVSLKLDNSDNVKFTQSNDGLKANVDLSAYALKSELPGEEDYGVLSVTGKEGVEVDNTDSQNPVVKLTAETKASLAKADTALQTHQDISHLAVKTEVANIYATKEALEAEATTARAAEKTNADAAAAAQKTADDVTAAFNAFIADADKTGDAIDTLVEIQQYMTEDTAAFTALSKKVTDLEDGTKLAANADKLDGKDSTDFVLKTEATGYADILTKTEAATTYETKTDAAAKLAEAKKHTDDALANYYNKEEIDDKFEAIPEDKDTETTVTANYTGTKEGGVSGLKATKTADFSYNVEIDETVTFIFNCGNASV